jgi:hypothetical protein
MKGDCYAILLSVLSAPIPSSLQTAAKQLENLADYCDRMKQKYFA